MNQYSIIISLSVLTVSLIGMEQQLAITFQPTSININPRTVSLIKEKQQPLRSTTQKFDSSTISKQSFNRSAITKKTNNPSLLNTKKPINNYNAIERTNQQLNPNVTTKKNRSLTINHDRTTSELRAYHHSNDKNFSSKKNDKNTNNFIYDQYTQRRGTPKMLKLYCNNCDGYLIDYQKDGPGRLLRCYLDRIHAPEVFKKLQYEVFNVKTAQNFHCPECNRIIGKPMIYHSEDRPAFHLLNRSCYFDTN